MSELREVIDELRQKSELLAYNQDLETVLVAEGVEGANLEQVQTNITTLQSEITTLEARRAELEE
jgi:outer membrane murein-binding lipoprotein Lpp